MSWTFQIARGPAWSTRHRTKCRPADDMLEGHQNDTAEVQCTLVPAALESLAAFTHAMAGRFPTGTQQGFPSEICAAHDYSGDLVVTLRWVGPDEPPPLSLNDSRVLLLPSCLSVLTELDVKIRVWRKVVEPLTKTNAEDECLWPSHAFMLLAIPEPTIEGPTRLATVLAFHSEAGEAMLEVGSHEFDSRLLKRTGCFDESRRLHLCLFRRRGSTGADGGVRLPAEPSGQQREEQRPLRHLRGGGTLRQNAQRVATTWAARTFWTSEVQKVEKDASIMKQIRKAREERHLAQAALTLSLLSCGDDPCRP